MPEQQEVVVQRVYVAVKEDKALVVIRVLLVHKVVLELLVQLVLRVVKVGKALLEILDHKELPDHKVEREQTATLGQLVLQV